MKVLLVDDDVFIRAYLQHVLELRGHQVVECVTGLEGLAAVREQDFDLAIVDVVMPDMGGIELVSCLRDRMAKLPIVGISGGDPSAHVGGRLYLDLMTQAGADTVLEKPFEEKDFLRSIDHALNVHSQ